MNFNQYADRNYNLNFVFKQANLKEQAFDDKLASGLDPQNWNFCRKILGKGFLEFRIIKSRGKNS